MRFGNRVGWHAVAYFLLLINSVASSEASDVCKAIALHDVSPFGDPNYVVKRGDSLTAITQYVMDKRTRVTSFCVHGGGCFPTHVAVNSNKVEALRLTNCKVGARYSNSRLSNDSDDVVYGLEVLPTKVQRTELKKETAQPLFPFSGFRFRCDQNVNYSGWQCNGGTLYGEDNRDCCVTFFSPYKRRQVERGSHGSNKLMLVHTKAITSRPQGGADIEEILESIVMEKVRDEIFEGDCAMNGIKFIYSVINKRRRSIVGVFLKENRFQQMSLKWAAYPCNTEHVD